MKKIIFLLPLIFFAPLAHAQVAPSTYTPSKSNFESPITVTCQDQANDTIAIYVVGTPTNSPNWVSGVPNAHVTTAGCSNYIPSFPGIISGRLGDGFQPNPGDTYGFAEFDSTDSGNDVDWTTVSTGAGYIKTLGTLRYQPPQPPITAAMPDPAQLIGNVTNGVVTTGTAIWPMLALVGIVIAFWIAEWVWLFIAQSIGRKK